jgi:hypothetical protein
VKRKVSKWILEKKKKRGDDVAHWPEKRAQNLMVML